MAGRPKKKPEYNPELQFKKSRRCLTLLQNSFNKEKYVNSLARV